MSDKFDPRDGDGGLSGAAKGPIINIAPVSRNGMRFLMNFYGMSETGKTLSALLLAAGMEPDPMKRGLLDTEGGQRGRMYMESVPGGYLYASLSPPYTPERYIEALDAFAARGVTVLVTDSISHAWFAEGGVLEMAENSKLKNDMAKWKDPKRRLQKMQQRYRSADMHHIFCSRAKQPLIDDPNNSSKKILGPVVPVQEKMMRYDMTIIAHMLGDGRYTIAAPAGKCPGPLRNIFDGEKMTPEMGAKLVQWIGGQDFKTPAQQQLETKADAAAEGGSEAFRAFWKDLTADQRATLKRQLPNYQSVANATDAEKKRLLDQEREMAGDRTDGEADDPFAKPTVIETPTPATKPATQSAPWTFQPHPGKAQTCSGAAEFTMQLIAAIDSTPDTATLMGFNAHALKRLENVDPDRYAEVMNAAKQKGWAP